MRLQVLHSSVMVGMPGSLADGSMAADELHPRPGYMIHQGKVIDLSKIDVEVDEVRFETKGTHLLTGKLDQQLMAEDEQLFQQLWRTYFKTIAIKERINPKLHRQNLPVRFWKYLTEK